MNKNFENNIVLTSQNPEAFLTFDYDGTNVSIEPSINIDSNLLYINGWTSQTLNDSSTSGVVLSLATNGATFHLFTDSKEDFDYNLHLDTTSIGPWDVSVFNRPFLLDPDDFNQYETAESLIDDEASYLLMRTNPKYSGNVKLMIDTSDNLYLDTFKVSDILSNKKYRKQKVSGNSYLSGDIRRVFESLPAGEIFKVDSENTLDLTHPKTEYYDQYNQTYSYGSRILVDELYDPEYSILAPLWINSKLPDYFVAFRMDGVFNESTYDGSPNLDSLANEYLINGELIESWNLKENQPVGKYLYNHLEELLKVETPVNLSLNEYDPNTWQGMTVDKGIIAGRSEVPYFFQKVTNNFTDTNAFVSQGFERQNLLIPNLINMEFMFNDVDVSLYSMHRYFGLYLTENELYKFYYYKENDDASINIVSLDGKDINSFIDSSIFVDGSISSTYENRIFVRNDGEKLERICCVEQFDETEENISEYVNKLGSNILNTYANKLDIKPFISFTLNTELHQGEHLRVINNTQFKVWEVYGSDSDIFEAGDAGPYASHNEAGAGYPELYRTGFSTKGTISEQIASIKKAFSMFADYEEVQFYVSSTTDDTISIMVSTDDDDVYTFQRITSQLAFPIGDASSVFNGASGPEDVTFYGSIIPSSDDFERILYDSSFGPIDLELYGDRNSITLNMFDPGDYHVYSFDVSIADLFTTHVLYEATDGLNRLIQTVDISTAVEYELQYVVDPISSENKAIIITENEINLDEDDVWWGYNVSPISVSLMGINPVKDFDFTVYDSSTNGMDFKSSYRNDRSGDEETYKFVLGVNETRTINERNSYTITSGTGSVTIDSSVISFNTSVDGDFTFNTFFGEAEVYSDISATITYNTLDGSHNYESYASGVSEESINDYYVDSATKEELKYGLVVPTVSKWGGNGKDVRNNDMRLLLNTDLFPDPAVTNSNFLASADISTYNGEISYPIFKYLSSGGDNWKDYVYYDINDVIDTDDGRKSVRDLIFDKPYIDIFSKIVYNNHDLSGTSLRSSILYYNLYENKLITLIKGLQLGLTVTPTGEKSFSTTKWDRYRFSFITSPSRNLDSNQPIEVIVNENTETVLMIWYQGSDILNYSKRWSSTIGGKSALTDQNSIGGKEYSAFFTGDPSYSYIKAPYIVNTSSLIHPTINMFDVSTNYSSSVSSPFAEFSYNRENGMSSIFNAYGLNSVVDSVFTFNPTDSFQTFNQSDIVYNYVNNTISYGNSVTNVAYNYSTNENYYKDKTCGFEILDYLILNNKIKYSVIQEDSVLTSDLFAIPPLEISVLNPIEYKSPGAVAGIYIFNGGFKPLFKNIMNFNNKESNVLTNIVEGDFIFSNTDLASYESLNQYWYNVVVDQVRDTDSSNNIDFLDEFNPFKSIWDESYFTLKNDGSNKLIDGFNSSLEMPSFFGSKLVSLPNELVLEKWSATNSKIVYGVDYYSLEYNLTKAIVDLFTNKIEFINNWSSIPGVSDEIINRYIIKTVLGYYNISINKINVYAYSKVFDETILEKTNDGSFTELLKNINGKLTTINNEQIYKIRYNREDVKSYYTKFTFTKK